VTTLGEEIKIKGFKGDFFFICIGAVSNNKSNYGFSSGKTEKEVLIIHSFCFW
jgi:hypothetical protein